MHRQASPSVLTSKLDLILDACFELSDVTSLDQLCLQLGLSRLATLRCIASSPVMDMIGLSCSEGSEEEAEFFGLALAGVPLRMALRWCSATLVSDDRPTSDDLCQAMTGPDLRAGLLMVSEAGLSMPPQEQLACLEFLGRQTLANVVAAAAQIARPAPCARRVALVLQGLKQPGDVDEMDAWDGRAFDGFAGQRSASMGHSKARNSGKSGAKANGSWGYRSKGRGTKRWGGKRRGASASYPTGAPTADRRTAAEKAWESRTHW